MTSARYLISGTLTTASPLHLGSGGVTRREGLVHPETKDPVDVNAVMVDHRPRPYLPGTSLKGVLRRWCEGVGTNDLVGELFGTEELGGAAEVWDAPALAFDPSVPPPSPEIPGQHPLRWWSEERWTEVAPRVALDRTTGTASHRRLFHDEYVPAGVSFDVGTAARTTKEGAALLLASLQAFHEDSGGLALGADTGNGWGRLRWELKEVRRLDSEGARRWLDAGCPSAGWAALEPVGPEELEGLQKAASLLGSPIGFPRVSVSLQLSFDGLFLVNDPSRTGEGEELPSHAARLAPDGSPLLPATSFRGALRTQAERILRTVAGEQAACGPGAPRPLCDPPRSIDETENLCPACRLFGAAGWRSPVSVSDFTVGPVGTRAGAPRTQELIAIDRFTGGGAPGLKFNAQGFDSPVLQGTVAVDLEALARGRGGLWALGLLALTLRDLVEGDVSFGFGAGKGFGRAKAAVVDHERPTWEAIPAPLREAMELLGLGEEHLRPGAADRLLDADSTLGIAFNLFIDQIPDRFQPATSGGS